MDIRMGNVKTVLLENRVWLIVGLLVIISAILWPILVMRLNREIEEQTDTLVQIKDRLADFATNPQTITNQKVLESEQQYLRELNAQLGKMGREVGKGTLEWDIVSPEPGEKYPDPRKFKLEYGQKKQLLLTELRGSLVQFNPRTLNDLFWNIQGEPSDRQMLTIQKEFTIIKGLLHIITDPKMAVSYVETFTVAVNRNEKKFVPLKVGGAISLEQPAPEPAAAPAAAAAAVRNIPIKLILRMDYRILIVLLDAMLRSDLKINFNIRRIERVGTIGEKDVNPLVDVDMDVEVVDFNPTL